MRKIRVYFFLFSRSAHEHVSRLFSFIQLPLCLSFSFFSRLDGNLSKSIVSLPRRKKKKPPFSPCSPSCEVSSTWSALPGFWMSSTSSATKLPACSITTLIGVSLFFPVTCISIRSMLLASLVPKHPNVFSCDAQSSNASSLSSSVLPIGSPRAWRIVIPRRNKMVTVILMIGGGGRENVWKHTDSKTPLIPVTITVHLLPPRPSPFSNSILLSLRLGLPLFISLDRVSRARSGCGRRVVEHISDSNPFLLDFRQSSWSCFKSDLARHPPTATVFVGTHCCWNRAASGSP